VVLASFSAEVQNVLSVEDFGTINVHPNSI
jgi:hypothetical protein